MLSTAIASFVAVFAALFPVINSLGAGPIFLNMVQGCSQPIRAQLARKISFNSFIMLVGSMLIGPQLLLFFGISLPALKIAGGVVIIAVGWNLLSQKSPSDKDGSNASGITDATASSSAFFPLTMPLTVGPGSIATSISLVAGHLDSRDFHLIDQLPSVIGALSALFVLSVIIYFVYREASGLQRLLGANGTNVLMRLFAFILLAIGVQIFLGGAERFAVEITRALPSH